MNPNLIVSAARTTDSGFEYVEIPVSLTDNALIIDLIERGWMTWFVRV